MTDHLEDASREFFNAGNARDELSVLRGLALGMWSYVEHLRTTPTATARTEEIGCPKCPEAAEEARRTGASVKCYGCSLYIAPLSTATARTEEKPLAKSDCECPHCNVALDWDRSLMLGTAILVCPKCRRSWDGHSPPRQQPAAEVSEEPSDAFLVQLIGTVPECAKTETTSYDPGIIDIAIARSAFIAGRSSSARELAELDDTLTQLRSALQCGPGDELTQVRAAKRYIDEQQTELAELREKVRVWTPVVEAVGMATGTSDATILAMALGQFDAIPAHLRPGSGSDEGKG